MSVSPHRPNVPEAEGNHPAPLILLPNHPQTGASVVPSPTPGYESEPLWITDELLFNYQRCRRRSYLDAYGDQQHCASPSDYLMKLRQDSLAHQMEIFSESPAHRPEYPRQDWAAGARATLELMAQGVDRIVKGVLHVSLDNGVHLVSCPDLLIRQPGYSLFGDWVYVPMDIRLGKRPKVDYQVAAAFHAYVLAEVQGAWAETSWLMLRQRGAYAVNLVDMLPRMQEILQDCIHTLRQDEAPEVFIAHNRCDLCQWLGHCYGIAQSEQHLSLLPGVTPSRYAHLKELGLLTLEDLHQANPKLLEPLPGFGWQVTHRLIRQARATLHNQALPDILFANSLTEPLLSVEELPTAPIELYFDIEAAPEQNLVYLHGILVVDRQSGTETFHALLAETQAEEQLIWEQLLELMWQYPYAPVFHFCPYEVQTMKRLAEQYNTDYSLIEPLLDRFVDLHERVTRVAILPVESYALKPIARWIGFDWRNPEANGAQSICWYAQWVGTGDRSFLEAILHYNEDDCRATYWVKNWLVEFCQGRNG
ncbi:TM0106 family RecB-like putative nuclease [Egbenema bharatensis]|uniref:TM0106 family RecB-like putative nuclease n=1 Tax=Egbenema bharatensis TaxID=3463334 RepID=UPI003A850370